MIFRVMHGSPIFYIFLYFIYKILIIAFLVCGIVKILIKISNVK